MQALYVYMTRFNDHVCNYSICQHVHETEYILKLILNTFFLVWERPNSVVPLTKTVTLMQL